MRLPGAAVRLAGKAIRAIEYCVRTEADAVAMAALPLSASSNGETKVAIATTAIVTKCLPTLVVHAGAVT